MAGAAGGGGDKRRPNGGRTLSARWAVAVVSPCSYLAACSRRTSSNEVVQLLCLLLMLVAFRVHCRAAAVGVVVEGLP